MQTNALVTLFCYKFCYEKQEVQFIKFVHAYFTKSKEKGILTLSGYYYYYLSEDPQTVNASHSTL